MTEDSKTIFYGSYIFIVLPVSFLYVLSVLLVIDAPAPLDGVTSKLSVMVILAVPAPILYSYWRSFIILVKSGQLKRNRSNAIHIRLICVGLIYSVLSAVVIVTTNILNNDPNSLLGGFFFVGICGLPLFIPFAHLVHEYRKSMI